MRFRLLTKRGLALLAAGALAHPRAAGTRSGSTGTSAGSSSSRRCSRCVSPALQLDELVPERVVARIAPRRLLLIAGTDDTAVPRWMTERLYAAALEPKQRLVIRGAQDGSFLQAGAETYTKGLVDFFGLYY
jgi:fermentation-respiration switch protein FrsA (DUF1100 family)